MGDPTVKTRDVQTVYGPVQVAMSTTEKTGHAKERHLTITERGLEERTHGEDGIPIASAFLQTSRFDALVWVVTKSLNSTQGQEALAILDTYEQQGKTRVAIVVAAADIGCTQIPTRMFYQGAETSVQERLRKVCVVIDSNLGGKYPIKIITAFPCTTEDPSLQVGLSSVMVQCRDMARAGTPSSASAGVPDIVDRCMAWGAKSLTHVPADLQIHRGILMGDVFTSAWFKPNPALYRYQFPIQRDHGAEVMGGPQVFETAIGSPPEKHMSIPLLEAEVEQRGRRVHRVHYGEKLVVFFHI